MAAIKNPLIWLIIAVELMGLVVLVVLGYGQYYWIYGVFAVITVTAIAVYQSRKNKVGSA
jgi:hypothetical protein